jgi:hypothetical protein
MRTTQCDRDKITRRSNQNRGNRNKRGELTSQQYTRHRFIITGQISNVLSRSGKVYDTIRKKTLEQNQSFVFE